MSVSIELRLAAASIVLAATAACTDPAPRSSANPLRGLVPSSTDRGANTPYYQGADPANPRPGMGAKGGGS